MNSMGIEALVRERVLVLDGAMGSLIGEYGLGEQDFCRLFHDAPVQCGYTDIQQGLSSRH